MPVRGTVDRQFDAVRTRANRLVLLRVAATVAAVTVSLATICVVAAMAAPSEWLRSGIAFCAVGLGSTLVWGLLWGRRAWRDDQAVARAADATANLKDRLLTYVSQRVQPTEAVDELARQLAELAPRWSPEVIVPRVVPRAPVAALVVAVGMLAALLQFSPQDSPGVEPEVSPSAPSKWTMRGINPASSKEIAARERTAAADTDTVPSESIDGTADPRGSGQGEIAGPSAAGWQQRLREALAMAAQDDTTGKATVGDAEGRNQRRANSSDGDTPRESDLARRADPSGAMPRASTDGDPQRFHPNGAGEGRAYRDANFQGDAPPASAAAALGELFGAALGESPERARFKLTLDAFLVQTADGHEPQQAERGEATKAAPRPATLSERRRAQDVLHHVRIPVSSEDVVRAAFDRRSPAVLAGPP